MQDFELERDQTRSEVAAYLHKLAEGLEHDRKLTFIDGDESATINPPRDLHVRKETKVDSSWLGGDTGRSFILEPGWEADETDADEELTIVDQPKHPSARGESEQTAPR